jgi:hypothetical protein
MVVVISAGVGMKMRPGKRGLVVSISPPVMASPDESVPEGTAAKVAAGQRCQGQTDNGDQQEFSEIFIHCSA